MVRTTRSTRSSGSSDRQAKAPASRSGRTRTTTCIANDLFNCALKHGQLERLAQNIEATVGRLSRIGKAAGQQDRQVGELLAAYLRQPKPVHGAGHDAVRNRQRNTDPLMKR